MRLPNHITLDFLSNKNITTRYWFVSLLELNNTQPSFLTNQSIIDKIINSKTLKIKIFKKKQFNLALNNNASFQKLINTKKLVNSEYKLNTLVNISNTVFLKKEPIYTKLKYSRTAAYDIVGGGAALFLAGLLGFLVTEKFGFELVDSGDFYYLFMYGVFLVFSLRPLLVVINPQKSLFNALSLKPLIEFYNTILLYILNFFK